MSSLIQRVRRYADAHGAADAPLETPIPGFTVMRTRRPTPIEPTLYKPLLCVVLQGRKECTLGREVVGFGQGESLIVAFDLPSASHVTEASEDEPYVALALEIDLDEARSLDAELGDSEVELNRARARAMAAGTADDALLDALERLFDLVDRPLERRVLLPVVTREIHYRMLLAGHGAMLRRLSWKDSNASRIARAIVHIREAFPSTVSVPELARTAGMSPSSFHHHFKDVTATTPLQYQKDLQLLAARERLLAGARSVSSVAYDVGYGSPTQFSRDYVRKFGKPPSADRARSA